MPCRYEQRSFAATVAYDGGGFRGWAPQNGLRTVCGELRTAIEHCVAGPAMVYGASRTDAGVHAAAQRVTVRARVAMPATELLRAINRQLPSDLALLELREVPRRFHAHFSSRSKSYRYCLCDGGRDSPPWAWAIDEPLDVTAMDHAARALRGCHDFGPLSFRPPTGRTTERTVLHTAVERRRVGEHPDLVVVSLHADGFLRRMMRRIVGLLAEVGRGATPPSALDEARGNWARLPHVRSAPAHGLMLLRVHY